MFLSLVLVYLQTFRVSGALDDQSCWVSFCPFLLLSLMPENKCSSLVFPPSQLLSPSALCVYSAALTCLNFCPQVFSHLLNLIVDGFHFLTDQTCKGQGTGMLPEAMTCQTQVMGLFAFSICFISLCQEEMTFLLA